MKPLAAPESVAARRRVRRGSGIAGGTGGDGKLVSGTWPIPRRRQTSSGDRGASLSPSSPQSWEATNQGGYLTALITCDDAGSLTPGELRAGRFSRSDLGAPRLDGLRNRVSPVRLPNPSPLPKAIPATAAVEKIHIFNRAPFAGAEQREGGEPGPRGARCLSQAPSSPDPNPLLGALSPLKNGTKLAKGLF